MLLTTFYSITYLRIQNIFLLFQENLFTVYLFLLKTDIFITYPHIFHPIKSEKRLPTKSKG